MKHDRGATIQVAVSSILATLLLNFCSVCFADESTQSPSQISPDSQQAAAAEFFSQIALKSNNPYIISVARENAAQLSLASRTVSIPDNSRYSIPVIAQADSSIAVPAVVNGQAMGTFIIDTGSSYTVITPRMATKLGLAVTPDLPRISIITANGVIQAPIVTLKNVVIGQVRVTEVQAIIQDLGKDLMLSGLLGMNFFKGKSLTIRQDQLILEETRDSAKLSIR
jgi:clan AA aspartic protease (TIGR02281 family)